MAIKRHITHIKMSGDTAPLARQLMYGELGVNYGKDHEKLYIKNSEDEIIPIETESQSHEYVDNKVISGNSLGVKVEDNNGNTSSPRLGNAPIKVTHTPAGNVVQTISGSSGTVLVEGSSFNIPTVSIDQFGHVKSGSTTSVKISDTFRYITGVTNTDEITLAVDANRKLSATHSGHTNGGIASGTSGTFILSYNKDNNTGATFNLPTVTYNKYGHIISSGTTSVTLKLQQASESAWGDVKMVQTTGSSTELVMSQDAVTKAIQQSFIENSALRYKGTVSSYNELQTKGADHKVGDLYKVSATFVIPGTNPEVKVEPGDMFIANTSGTTFNLSHWDIIQTNINPDLYVLKTTKVIAGNELSGGGSLSGDVTINHVTKFTGTGKTSPNTAQTYTLNGTTGFDVPIISYNEYGHITATTTTTVRVTAATATQSSDGLMSSTDKATLDHLASAATNVSVTNLNPNGDKNLASITVDGSTTYIKSGPHSALTVSATTTNGSGTESTTTKVLEYDTKTNKGLKVVGDDAVHVSGTTDGGVLKLTLSDIDAQYRHIIFKTNGGTNLSNGEIGLSTTGITYKLNNQNYVIPTDEVAVSASTPTGETVELWVDTTNSPTANTYTTSQIDGLLSHKQGLLTSGVTIKTINNESLLGSGNINIQGGGGDYVPLSGGTMTGTLTAPTVVSNNGFQKSGSDNNSVLLAGGGTKALSEIGNRVYIDGNTLVI